MSTEADAARKDQQRLKGDNTIPQGGGNDGTPDKTTAPPKTGSGNAKADAEPQLTPAKPGDS